MLNKLILPLVGAVALPVAGGTPKGLVDDAVVEHELAAGETLTFSLKQRDIAARWTLFMAPTLPWLASQGRFIARPDGTLPLQAFVSQTDGNRVTVAASDLSHRLELNGYLKYENGSEIELSVRAPDGLGTGSCRVRVDTRRIPYWDSVREAAEWMASFPENRLEPAPEAAFEPLWDSWYAYRTGITAEILEREGAAAAALGIKTILYDMGWDREGNTSSVSFRPCGDWNASPKSFPDMPGHIARMHAMGLRTLIWFGYPLLGKESENFGRLRPFCLGQQTDHRGTLTLDPRAPEAFALVSNKMCRALRDWRVDGFKIDFIQTFAAHGAPFEAVLDFEERLDAAFRAIRPDALVEYMAPYGGIRNLRYATHVRAADCPGDAFENRMRTVRLRLTSGPKAVHCDMLTWDDSESVGSAAIQIISVLHSTLQFGRSLQTLTPEHRKMVENWLKFAAAHRETLLKGAFRPHGVTCGCPLIEMESAHERILTVHQPDRLCPLGAVGKPTHVINGSGTDALVVETASETSVDVYGPFGEVLRTRRLPAGLTRLSCPLGGRIRFSPSGH